MTRHTFEGRVLFYTAKALMFISHYWHAPMWFPRSQCEVEQDGDETHVIKVRDWLCEKNNVKEFTEYTAEEIEERSKRD